mmetsp:Transcript_16769/g.27810  ORF Transcript_16769/g.27810 Transcript_16769/m.27810 type:complete len:161 (-) Transcript_16769:400-882(-)
MSAIEIAAGADSLAPSSAAPATYEHTLARMPTTSGMPTISVPVSPSALIFWQGCNSFRRGDDGRVDNERHAFLNPRDSPNLPPVQTLEVWGGEVFNGGEHDLSRLVDTHAMTLRSILYFPRRTKGGALIRPKYHQGDRGGVQSFPVLETMAIRFFGCFCL